MVQLFLAKGAITKHLMIQIQLVVICYNAESTNLVGVLQKHDDKVQQSHSFVVLTSAHGFVVLQEGEPTFMGSEVTGLHRIKTSS